MKILKGFLGLVMIVFASCGPDECNQIQGSEAMRRFAYNLYAKTVIESDPQSNIFLAPTTVANALAMVLAGSNGTTKEQILRGLISDSASYNFTEDILQCVLRTNNDFSGDSGNDSQDMDRRLLLKTATRIFGERTYKFARRYLHHADSFGARLKKVDFVGKPAAARKRINRWVARQTEDKIRDLFSEDDIDSSTILAIVSAIYFKGLWQIPFEERFTRPLEFHVTESKTVQADFMFKSDKFNFIYSDDLNARLLEIPYQGSATRDVSMIILLPVRSMTDLEQKFTHEHLTPEISKLLRQRPFEIDLRLPKFKISAEYDLKPILERMGIRNMFSPVLSNLSGMRSPTSNDQRPLYVSSAIHKTFIEVDEEGTEAAGATGITISLLSLPPQIICNRPFLVIIYEKQSNSILFIGKVNDPTSE